MTEEVAEVRTKNFVALLAGIAIGLVGVPAMVSGQEAPPEARTFDSPASVYVPLSTQCVLFDTRPSQGGSGPIGAGATRRFAVRGDLSHQGGDSGCAVGVGADGYHLNLVAIDPAGAGNLKAWPAGEPEPNGGIVNYSAASTMNNSNAFHVPNATGGLDVKANGPAVQVRGVLYGILEDGGDFYADEALVSSDKWAKVDADAADATLLHGAGATSVARIATGIFSVTFDSSVVGCGWQATLNDNLDGVVAPGEVGIELASSIDPTTLWVRIWDSAGSPRDPSSSDGFTINVDC